MKNNRKNQGKHVRKNRFNNGKKLLIFILVSVIFIGYFNFYRQPIITSKDMPSWITQDLIYDADPKDSNINRITDIVIHYTANPGSTAKQNRDYFAQDETKVNSHFVVGINGEIIQCVPLFMQSAASNNRNHDTISIEVCHPDATGQFTIPAYNSTVKLTAWLCDKYNISRDRVIRHGDITGKNCPKYFMEHEDDWLIFKDWVKKYDSSKF